jgi:hypothetical protein
MTANVYWSLSMFQKLCYGPHKLLTTGVWDIYCNSFTILPRKPHNFCPHRNTKYPISTALTTSYDGSLPSLFIWYKLSHPVMLPGSVGQHIEWTVFSLGVTYLHCSPVCSLEIAITFNFTSSFLLVHALVVHVLSVADLGAGPIRGKVPDPVVLYALRSLS